MSDETDSGARAPSGHVSGLDGIRALAVGLVLFAHSVIYDAFSHLRPIGLSAGYAGVAVFFVLSGYLITTLLLREEERTGNISLRLLFATSIATVPSSLALFACSWRDLDLRGLTAPSLAQLCFIDFLRS